MTYYATAVEARAARPHVQGWNLRCNRCGTFGATWVPSARGAWGCLALCDPHRAELSAEYARHAASLQQLCVVNYEQPRRSDGA